jgi:hypothetical protein
VWAAGDVARVDGRRVEHWHAAREAGERAALSMLGLPPSPVPPPWVFSEMAGTTVDVVGALDGWDDERWLMPGRLIGYLDSGRLVGLASIDNALGVEVGRRLVADGGSPEEAVELAR